MLRHDAPVNPLHQEEECEGFESQNPHSENGNVGKYESNLREKVNAVNRPGFNALRRIVEKRRTAQ